MAKAKLDWALFEKAAAAVKQAQAPGSRGPSVGKPGAPNSLGTKSKYHISNRHPIGQSTRREYGGAPPLDPSLMDRVLGPTWNAMWAHKFLPDPGLPWDFRDVQIDPSTGRNAYRDWEGPGQRQRWRDRLNMPPRPRTLEHGGLMERLRSSVSPERFPKPKK